MRRDEAARRWDKHVALEVDLRNVLDASRNKKELEECQDLNRLSLSNTGLLGCQIPSGRNLNRSVALTGYASL